jgi:hypothetical protein
VVDPLSAFAFNFRELIFRTVTLCLDIARFLGQTTGNRATVQCYTALLVSHRL